MVAAASAGRRTAMTLQWSLLALIAAVALALPEPEESFESRLAVVETAFAERSGRQLAKIRRLEAEVRRLRRGSRRRGERQHRSEAPLRFPQPATGRASPALAQELEAPEAKELALARRLQMSPTLSPTTLAPTRTGLCVSRANGNTFIVDGQAQLLEFVAFVRAQGCSQIGAPGSTDSWGVLLVTGQVTSLAPLRATLLRRIWGDFQIQATELRDLSGLEMLERVQNLIVLSNPKLQYFAGLRAAVQWKLAVRHNPVLVSLAGPRVRDKVREVYFVANDALNHFPIFDEVVVVMQALELKYNRRMDDLSAFRRLRFIGASLTVDWLPVVSLEGFHNLEVVWGLVRIENNEELLSFRGLHKLRLTGMFKSARNHKLQVLGGLFSDAPPTATIGTVEALDMPKCVTPQEWGSITGGFLMTPATLDDYAFEPTRATWLSNGCGPDEQACWVGLPCVLDLGNSSFRGYISLPATGKTCGPCHADKPTAVVGSDGKVDITPLLGGVQPGMFSVCKCESGPTGAAAIAQFSYLGPRDDHSLACIRGSPCTFSLQGMFNPNAQVTLERTCGAQAEERIATASMGGDGTFSLPEGTKALATVAPGTLRLCWRPPCDQIPSQSKCVEKDIGHLDVLGPYPQPVCTVTLGSPYSVPNLGVGVLHNDSMRLLTSCGSSESTSLVSTSGTRFIFEFSTDARSVGPGTYRKCWCNGASLSCNESSHFLVDIGSVDIVCPADEEPIAAGQCRSCQPGTFKDKRGNFPCKFDFTYVSKSVVFSMLVFMASFATLVTFRSPIRVDDVSTVTGSTFVSTMRAHGLHKYGVRTFDVHFHGTGHTGLDRPPQPFKAARSSPTGLKLLNRQGQSTDCRLDTSRGFVTLPPLQELWHRGWPVPLLVSVPSLLAAALLVHFMHGQSLEHAAMGAGAALVVALAIRVALRSRRLRNHLDRRIEDYRKVLRAKNPHPTPCEKGPQRAIEIGELVRLLEFFQSFIRDRTAYYMDTNIFGPLTKHTKLSYAELVGPKKVQWFVSHYWGNSFTHFCEAVQKHAEWVAQDQWREVAYWICFCSNNQYQIQEELGSNWSQSSFFLALRSGLCKGVCMVLDDTAMPLTRSWCIFEVLQALQLEQKDEHFSGLMLCTSGGVLNVGQGSVEVAMNLARRIATLDLESAGASCEKDKVMINDQVVKELGSFDAMNQMVRHKMRDILLKARTLANSSFDDLFKLLDGKGETFGVKRGYSDLWQDEEVVEKDYAVDYCFKPLESAVHALI